MNKILNNDTLLKIVSVLVAFVIWAYIIIVIDAPTEKTFRDVPITTVNEQILSDNGYSIEKLSVQTAIARIEGSRRVISKFSSDNISAKLDFSEVNALKLSTESSVTVNLTVSSEFGEVVAFTPSAVEVSIEPTKYKDVDVRYTTSGEVLEDYVHDEITLSQNKIRIFGAQSNVDNVEYASVNVDLINTDYSAYNQGFLSQECYVKLFNSSGKELVEKESRWIWINTPSIVAECHLFKVKTVKVVPNVDYTLSVDELKFEPSEVKIYGDNQYIKSYTKIDTEPITKESFDTVNQVTLKLILPAWAKTVDDVTEVKVRENINQ